MPDSIREQIVKHVVTTLEGITVANGYTNTIAEVQRWEQDGNTKQSTADDKAVIVVECGPEEQDDDVLPFSMCTLSLNIDLSVQHDKAAHPVSTDEYLNSFLADVKKALAQDTTRGGLADLTKVTGSVPFQTLEEQPYAGITITVEIQYRHLHLDPASQG